MVEKPETFHSFYKTVEGGEGDRCKYPTRLDVYGCGCKHNCSYCVDPDTRILMADSTEKRISEVNIGDRILGVNKEKYFKYTESTVLDKWEVMDDAYRIVLNDGRELICSGNHRWLSNRGWKYTFGTMSGEYQRPYLTTSNYLVGFPNYGECVIENDDYCKGYLRGIINGDGTRGVYPDYRDNHHSMQYMFKLVMKGQGAVERTARYFDRFGIVYQWYEMNFKDRDGIIRPYRGIRFNNKESYDKMIALIEPIDSNEFKGGYLAGMYDSEGTSDRIIKRICNTNREYIDEIERYLNDLGFEYIEESGHTDIGTPIWNVRLTGGISQYILFVQRTNPALKTKWSFIGYVIKTFNNKENLRIKSIESIGTRGLIDITTTTENFIANGCVSHNCYARSLLDFRKNWHPNNPSVADRTAVSKVLDEVKEGTILRLGGMTDPFQPCEDEYHMNRWLIGELNRRGIGYLIVTKGANILEKNMDVLDKDLAHIQISYTHTEGYAPPGFENASPPSDRIRVADVLYGQGFDVALRLSPYIPQYINMKLITERDTDKVLVEFLRANAMIRKKMPYYDFSAWNQKQDGYQQLSLSAKRLLLKPLLATGKKISVCEDYTPHYKWFMENVNFDKDDCCMLRR